MMASDSARAWFETMFTIIYCNACVVVCGIVYGGA